MLIAQALDVSPRENGGAGRCTDCTHKHLNIASGRWVNGESLMKGLTGLGVESFEPDTQSTPLVHVWCWNIAAVVAEVRVSVVVAHHI